MPRLATPLLVAVLAHAAGAQWASVSHDPSNAIVVEGGLVAHDDGTSVQAFSAVTRRFEAVSPTGSAIVGTGDWTLLTFEEGAPGGYRAWSARVNGSVFLPGPEGIDARVADDVALIVRPDGPTLRATAYSAQANKSDSVLLSISSLGPFDVAVESGVIAIRDGDTYWGFGARTASWTPFTTADGAVGDVPLAKGNVAIASLFNTGTGLGERKYVGFSGVLGRWDASPDFHFSNSLELEHDVAYIRTETTVLTRFKSTGFSAYVGSWVTGATEHTSTSVVQRASDELILIESLDTVARFTAFGATTGAWSVLDGDHSFLGLVSDCAVVEDAGAGTATAISGLNAAGWQSRTVPGPAAFLADSRNFVAVEDGSGALHAFSAADGAWADAVDASAAAIAVGGSTLGVETAGALLGYATRWNRWTPGPTVAAGSNSSAEGSIFAAVDAATDVVHVFDERAEAWNGSYDPGSLPDLFPARNVLVVQPGADPGAVNAWSARRRDWSAPPASPLPAPFALGPDVEDDVAWLVDASGALWAFGACTDSHVSYDWPNGSGFQSFDPGGASFALLSLVGVPNEETVYLVASPSPGFPGFTLPGVSGTGCLPPSSAVVVVILSVEEAGVSRIAIPIGIPIAGQQYWFQGAFLHASGSKRFGAGCDAAWGF